MTKLLTSRRTVLVGAGALGLLIGVGAWKLTQKGPSVAGTSDANGAFLNDWIHVGRDGVVTLRTGQSEMGQGAFTGIATLAAEELGCRLDQMRVETGPASSVFKNIAVGREALAPNHGLAKGPPEGFGGKVFDFVVEAATQQITGGSSTIINGFDRARIVGAVAREMLVGAAAKQWGVAASECAVKDGVVVHAGSKRQLGFGDLAEAAAKETPPGSVTLKPREQWTLIGAPNTQRVDIPEKVDGSARYGIDVRRPGMLFAAVANCPEFGGALIASTTRRAAKMPGVVKVVSLDNAVAVVADTTWRAKAALAALQIIWKSGPAAKLDSEAIGKSLTSAVGGAGKVEAEGDFAAAYAGSAKKLSADYALPYLAHAAMEPVNCTAEVLPDRVEVWAPTQAQSVNVAAAAAAAGVSADKVNLHTTYLGGGFGRRLESDYRHSGGEGRQGRGQAGPGDLVARRGHDPRLLSPRRDRARRRRPRWLGQARRAALCDGEPVDHGADVSARDLARTRLHAVRRHGLDPLRGSQQAHRGRRHRQSDARRLLALGRPFHHRLRQGEFHRRNGA